jgi:hypothetical protein
VSKASLREVQRRNAAISIYRTVLNFALLVAAFKAFPDNQAFAIFAILLFNHSVSGIFAMINGTCITQNHLDDLGERKTRHAIVLACSADKDEYSFWAEVDRRVADEIGQEADASPLWQQAGAVCLKLLGMLAIDVVVVSAAMIFAS